MILSSAVRAYVCIEPTDMRKSIDGLVQLIEPVFKADPFCGHMFMFLGKARNKAKIVFWDRTGFWLLYKRLEKGRFPRPDELAARGLSWTELSAYLEGIDMTRMKRIKSVEASRVS
jgi:transposase